MAKNKLTDESGFRVQVTMTDSLVERIDNYAISVGISRSSAISVLCSQALQAQDAIKAMGDIATANKQQQERSKEEDR